MATEDTDENSLIGEFVLESSQGLKGIEQDLLALEENGVQPATINNIFRAIHTIKSSSGYLGLENIQRVAHLSETLLDQIRKGERTASSACVDVLLRAIDALLEMVAAPDLGGDYDAAGVIDRLDELVKEGAPEAFRATTSTIAEGRDILLDAGITAAKIGEACKAQASGQGVFLIHVAPEEVLGTQQALAELGTVLHACVPKGWLVFATVLDAEMICISISASSEGVFPLLAESLHEAQARLESTPAPTSPEPAVPASAPVPAPSHAPAAASSAGRPPARSDTGTRSAEENGNGNGSVGRSTTAGADEGAMLKINARLLDELLRLTGNMVMSRNQLLTRYNFADDQAFATLSQAITEVHRSVVQTRMESVGAIFNRFRRVVRDLAKKLGKNIELQIEGGEMELDRTIVEAFIDPLTHMVRNCVDHALESPDERRKAAKPHLGRIVLKAYQESGEIIIAVQDDGRGIDPARIRTKAVEKGLLPRKAADELTDSQALRLIFEPGFSTAEKVTDVSGRGVGMDVVRTNIEKIGGVVDLESEIGVGTTFHARLPLTKAMVASSLISALIIEVAEQRFCIPQSAVNELINILPREYPLRVKHLQGQMVFQHRELVLPIIRLEEALGVEGANPTSATEEPIEPRTLIVLQHRQHLFGVLVDRIIGIEEAVVREMPSMVRSAGVFAGHSVLGDGRVVLIIDINGIVERIGMRFLAPAAEARERMPALSVGRRADRQTMIIFNYHDSEYFAIPLELVSLVEKIPSAEIRSVGPRHYYPHKGDTIPLLYLDKHLPVTPISRTLKYYNLILPARVRFPIGLITNSDIRVAEISERFDAKITHNKGILGTFMHEKKLVMLLDLYSLFEHDAPEHFDTAVRDQGHPARVLIVEDSLFYRRLNSTYLAAPNRQLTVAADGKEALTTLRSNPTGFDLVITDIEMPIMDGFELVRAIRSDPLLRHLPVVALTALQDERSRARGREAGFTEYVIKVDKDSLISCVNRYTSPSERSRTMAASLAADAGTPVEEIAPASGSVGALTWKGND